MKVLSRLFIFMFVVLVPSISVNAETVNDLFNLYGITSMGEDRSIISDELLELRRAYTQELIEKGNVESYNSALSVYNNFLQEKYEETLSQIEVISTNNSDLKKEMEDSIFTSSISDLQSMDNMYKMNSIKVSTLLSELTNYEVSVDFLEYDISNMQNMQVDIDSLNDKLETSVDYFKLGDVSKVDWVLSRPYYKTCQFGYRVDPIVKNRIQYHAGTDYRAEVGTTVYALFNGVVTDCGYSSTAGNYITIQCGDYVRYFMCHLSEICVEKGQVINQYDIVAKTGNTGSRTTGPHFHLALYINGIAVDADKLFGGLSNAY